MSEKSKVTNIVVAGVGGQGVLKASDILATAAYEANHDVKKSEIHGLSQRGGSVATDVRFGGEVFSPMVPPGAADYLVILEATQIETNRGRLAEDGVLIAPADVLGPEGKAKDFDRDDSLPFTSRSFNITVLGVLSTHLDIAEEAWRAAIATCLPEKLHEANFAAFEYGRQKALSNAE